MSRENHFREALDSLETANDREVELPTAQIAALSAIAYALLAIHNVLTSIDASLGKDRGR